MAIKTIAQLRDRLLFEFEEVCNGKTTPVKALAMARLAHEALKSVQVEMMFYKMPKTKKLKQPNEITVEIK